MGTFVKHIACDECGSSDGNAVYDDGSTYCWVCEHTVVSDEYKKLNGDKPFKPDSRQIRTTPRKDNLPMVDTTPINSKPVIDEQTASDITKLPHEGYGFRGIRDDIYEKFRVRHKISNGDVIEQYYPVTQGGSLTGYKIRTVPKDFYSKGRVGAECDLFMQHKFPRGGKYILITEGEIDALSAYQMMNDYNKSRGSDFETAVVSPTIGKNAERQIALQYRFFDSFENIVICYDSDAAGKEAVNDLVKVLPKGKVKIMNMRLKDANEYLKHGQTRNFINDFYDAKTFTPVGVLGSGELYNKILEQADIPKIPFPPFMNKLNEMLVGGLPLGHIINIAAGTGLGKTSYMNEIVYFWALNSPHKIGIVSMELDAGQYGETILSRHLSRKLSLIRDDESKKRYLMSDEVKEKANNFFYTETGEHRFYLLDNRDGTIEEIQDTIEELVISCGCKVIILDPLQDIIDGLSIEEQAMFMKWCKGIIKSHKVTLVLINHIRKAAGGGGNSSKGDSYTEEEIQGSSTIIKSASANILLSRNKYAEDEVERNTTKVMLSKNRICGITGPAGEVYYENTTHTLWDKEYYFSHTTDAPPEEPSE